MKHLFPIFAVIVALGVGCGPKKSAVTSAASLEELNRAVSVVAMRAKTFPPSTNELAAFLALSGKTLPIPPPGKKLVIDPSKREFVIVDQ